MSHHGRAGIERPLPILEQDFKMAIINGHFSPWAARHHLNDGVSDWLTGTEGEDVIHGFGGNDSLHGRGGHDEIYGGFGNDFIYGGTGWDTLTGGPGRDRFGIGYGESPATFAGSDIIADFHTHEDKIEFPVNTPNAFPSFNYTEIALNYRTNNLQANFNQMLDAAQDQINHNHQLQYIFGTNGMDGYLFADLDHDGKIDTGIELRGLKSTGDFAASDIFDPGHPNSISDLSHMNIFGH